MVWFFEEVANMITLSTLMYKLIESKENKDVVEIKEKDEDQKLFGKVTSVCESYAIVYCGGSTRQIYFDRVEYLKILTLRENNFFDMRQEVEIK